jgi:hypothetical protein
MTYSILVNWIISNHISLQLFSLSNLMDTETAVEDIEWLVL